MTEYKIRLGRGNSLLESRMQDTIPEVNVQGNITMGAAVGSLIDEQPGGPLKELLSSIYRGREGYVVRSSVKGEKDEQGIWFGDEIKAGVVLDQLGNDFRQTGTPPVVPLYIESGSNIASYRAVLK